MATEIRTVIDTGVAVIAVLLPRSVPRQAFDLAFYRGEVLVSVSTIDELDDVLRRPKFDRYVPEVKRLEFLSSLVNDARVVEVTTTITACRDADDDKFLELAVSGHATYIVTGDSDLLALNPFRSIVIATPADYIAMLSQQQ